MLYISKVIRLALCLCCIIVVGVNTADAQNKKRKSSDAEPFMHISFESPLWLSNPNTLDNSHKAGFGLRANFPIKQGPWNFVTGFSQYNYGNHLNILDRTGSELITGGEGTIKITEGTYLLKYASLPLAFKYDSKYWSTTFGLQLLFNLNQAEIFGEETTFIFGGESFEDFDKEKVNNFNPALTFSFAGQLPLGDRWTLYAEPELQYLIKPVYKDGIDEVNRANIFLKIGIRHLIMLPTEEVEPRK